MPLSIPSPPEEWQIPISIPIGWLHGLIPAIAENQVIAIHTYALCILAGIIAATLLVNSRLTRRGVESGVVLDVIIWAVPLGLVGARAYHVLTHPSDYFYDGADPWEVVRIWNGGNALFGSLIGGAVGAWIGCRLAGIRFWTFADALAPAMLLAQALGRFGNYFNHELFGQPTDLPWGLEIEASNSAYPVGLAEGTLFHPTFLYEMIWNVVGIVFLITMERRYRLVTRSVGGLKIPVPVGDAVPRLQWGKVWALYMIWYGIGRAWFESIRVDPSEVFFGIRTNVWGAIVAIILGIALFLYQSRRHPGDEPSAYVPGHQGYGSGAVDSPETYSETDEPGDDALAGSDSVSSGTLATSGLSSSDKLATSGTGTTRP
ncbi:prolipoprotein diacylglyceryl transferase [Salinibacterium sp. G-O1]|uniref:prolipoprotein diacylglyceryl transferase n=1 Tax=Salinibacterium sp. G-O1 TaxID=3046208 RepID=UPI0024BA2CC8|nr:prolipoprotein diacylglyceryl transferase [Salinibacterium sp. G-O1]MDJ0335160.1 prolipoprotein diacylglyceryl transferase [Salinibacterium sp. G-O1]